MIPFTPTLQDRASYGLPANYLRNMFVEGSPGGPTSDARMSRPGLLLSYTIGDGPIQGMYQNAGAGGAATYAVSDNNFYQDTTLRGNIPTGTVARFAASATQIVVVMGGSAYTWDGVSFLLVNDTDLPPNVYDVTYAGGRFIYVIAGSDTFYYSDIGDARAIDGFAFASAESSPDAIEAVATLSDEIAFFGQSSTEWWQVTADPDAPFQRTIGRRYDKGIIGQGTLQAIDNALVWVGNDLCVYRTGNVPVRISDHSIEEAIRKCGDPNDSASLTAGFDGHTIYLLTLPNNGSFALDLSNSTWAEWTSDGQLQFRCAWGCQINGVSFLGDTLSGKVFRLDPETYTDDNGSPIDRAVSVFVPVTGGFVTNSSIMLQCRRGVGNGVAPSPAVRLRYSDVAGASYNTTPGTVSLGTDGQYGFKQVWRRLGIMRSPGRLFEFSCPDAVSVVFEAITLNEGRP